MAQAEKKVEVKMIQPPPVRVEEETVVLTLSMREAKVLRIVTGQILGSPAGPRGTTSAIYRALASAGVAVSSAEIGAVVPNYVVSDLRLADAYPEGF